ncbi:MAG TPA: hypothetical protein VMI53_10520, partial [Opitutaceae bacterium]|nr:hypothetical protein [Opitutaceae bacterium]
MSLINDALKKAQKRHASGAAPLPPPVPGGAPADRPAARRSPLPSQLVILCALGAAVLIALSVLATVYLLRRPSAPGPVAAQPAAIPVPVEKPATPVLVQTTAPGGSPQAPASPVVAAAPLPPPV